MRSYIERSFLILVEIFQSNQIVGLCRKDTVTRQAYTDRYTDSIRSQMRSQVTVSYLRKGKPHTENTRREIRRKVFAGSLV